MLIIVNDIRFAAGTTQLQIHNEVTLTTNALPLGTTTSVLIVAYRQTFLIYLNGTVASGVYGIQWRTPLKATLSVSDPAYEPANANLEDLSLIPHSDQFGPNIVPDLAPKSVVLPMNYNISFKITPLAIISGLGSILKYDAQDRYFANAAHIW